jgi:hypothetical protein
VKIFSYAGSVKKTAALDPCLYIQWVKKETSYILVSTHQLHEQVNELVQISIAVRVKDTECGLAGAIVLDRATRS